MTICTICGEVAYYKKLCVTCKRKFERDEENIVKLVIAGHDRQCAWRQVWGDGECECDG